MSRLLGEAAWPLRLPIGRPAPRLVGGYWPELVSHLRRWRAVSVGRVVWESTVYRATGEAVEIPAVWETTNVGEWVAASASKAVLAESKALDRILAASNSLFHPLLVRQRSLWIDKPLEEVCQVAALALLLKPGCAEGVPLRAL